MKNNYLIFVICILLAVSSCCFAEDDTAPIWDYKLLDDETAMITAYTGTDTDVIIPSIWDGHSVTKLAKDVFWFNEEITSVEIPQTLISIEDYHYGEDLGWVSARPDIFDPEVARLFTDQFAEYAKETQINPFLGCLNLEKISVSPENPVFEVTDGLLINKAESKTVAYPAGRIDRSFEIPEGIKAIGFQTFYGSKLASVTLPESVSDISHNPFIFCPELSEIKVSQKNETFEIRNHSLINKYGVLLAYPCNAEAAFYEIPEGVTSIGAGAFINNQHLQSISFPDTLKEIGFRAFDYSFKLETVLLQEGVRSIGQSAYRNCKSLRDINLPASITFIADQAFENIGKTLVFKVIKDSYGELWVKSRSYRFHFPGEPEQTSRLTQVFNNLLDENGELTKFHLSYLAESGPTGYRLKRDIYVADGTVFIIDEDDKNGMEVRMHKDNMLYTLFPDSKTGKAVEDKLHWSHGSNDDLQEPKQLYTLISSHVNRTDYLSSRRMLMGSSYNVEVFPEYRYGPEIAFYFDVDHQTGDPKLTYVYEEKYYGTSPVDFATGELLFTIYEFSREFVESIFDISDYEITEQ